MSATVEQIQALTDDTFHDVVGNSEVPVLIDFWSPWCMPCRFLAPVLEEEARKYQGRVRFCKVDVQDNPRVASEFRISAVPTLLVFRDGKPVDRAVGLQSPADISALLDKVLAG